MGDQVNGTTMKIGVVTLLSAAVLTGCSGQTTTVAWAPTPTPIREAAARQEPSVRIINASDSTLHLNSVVYEPRDWGGPSPADPPPVGFQGMTLGPGESVQRTFVVETDSSIFDVGFDDEGSWVMLDQMDGDPWAGWGVWGNGRECRSDRIASGRHWITVECFVGRSDVDTIITVQ